MVFLSRCFEPATYAEDDYSGVIEKTIPVRGFLLNR